MTYLETAAQFYRESFFDDSAGHILQLGIPAAVCDKTAASNPAEIIVTNSTWHYSSGDCC